MVDEYRRLEAGRSRDQRPRPVPPDFVDLTAWADLSDEAVARELGCTTKRAAKDFAPFVADERSGQYDRSVAPGRTRCEAGVKEWLLLRCPRMAVPGDRWCTQHHPTPPEPFLPDGRISEWDRRLRPDGDLLTAVYAQTDRIDNLTSIINVALARLEAIEQRTEEEPAELLTVAQTAALLGVTKRTVYTMCTENRIPVLRIGSALRFRQSDLDEWMSKRMRRPLR